MAAGAANFTGSIPAHYDACLGPRIFEGYASDLAARVAAAGPKAVLELAAGTGIVTRKLRDALPSTAQLTATDLNAPMLDSARGKFDASESVSFQEADAMALPFPDAAFDCITCQFGVMFFPDKARSYEEAYRVLKAGGQYIFNVWDSWAHNDFARLAHEVVARVFPDNPPGFYKVPFGYRDTDEITATLENAGFTNIRAETLSLVSAIPSAQDFATGLVFGNPLFDEIRARNGNPDDIRDAVAVAIAEQLGEQMTLQAIVISAAK